MNNAKKLSITTSRLCPYYVYGVCKFGTNCRNSHDIRAQQDDICRYYQTGTCYYGSRCRYKHIKINKPDPKPEVGLGMPQTFNEGEVKASPQVTERKDEVKRSVEESVPSSLAEVLKKRFEPKRPVICPFFQKSGVCADVSCPNIHGEYCHGCDEFALDPNDADQRSRHESECNDLFEQRMEEAFAIKRSADKVCSICLDVVIDKPSLSEARFGLLQNCDHVFCLPCIRKWRASKSDQLGNNIVKACPECRICSDFVVPSTYWYENAAQKQSIVEGYKKRMAGIDCSHFNFGEGHCPFANKCFYRHRYRNGTEVKLGMPGRSKVLRGLNADGSYVLASEAESLYSFLRRENSGIGNSQTSDDWVNTNFNDMDILADILLEQDLTLHDID